MKDRQKNGSFTLYYTNCAYLTDGTMIDVKMDATVVCEDASGNALTGQKRAFYIIPSHFFGANNRNMEEESQGHAYVTVDATFHLYKHGTNTEIPNTFIMFFVDLDVAGRNGSYDDIHSEGVILKGGTIGKPYIGHVMTAAQGHTTDNDPTAGKYLNVGQVSGSTWIHSSHICDSCTDSEMAVNAKSGLHIIWHGRGNGMGSSLGLKSNTDYPAVPKSTKASESPVNSDGTATFTITQVFPDVDDSNKPSSITVTDTFAKCLDVDLSKMDISVTRTNALGTTSNVTSNWTPSVYGQTLTLRAQNTGHEQATLKHVFTIKVPIRKSYNFNDGQLSFDGVDLKFDNTATVKIKPQGENEISNNTNTVTTKIVGFTKPAILLQKADPNFGVGKGQGDATMEGATYKVEYWNNWTGDGNPHSTNTYTTNAAGELNFNQEMHFGTYRITETAAPAGYAAMPARTIYVRNSNASGGMTITSTASDWGTGDTTATTGLISVEPSIAHGGIEIHKVDADDDSAIPQGDAGAATADGRSFRGVTYWVYNKSTNPVYIKNESNPFVAGKNSYDPNEVCIAVQAGDDGVARLSADTLPYGSYMVKEAVAVDGYLNSNWVADFKIRTDGEIVVFNQPTHSTDPHLDKPRNYEQVMRGGVSVAKYDQDWLTPNTQGDAADSFEGTKYEIYNRSASYVYVDGTKHEKDTVVKVIETDDSGVATTGNMILPYGTYEIRESQPVEGYVNSGWSRTFTIRDQGFMQYYRADEPTERNEDPVIRGGIEIHKVDADTKQVATQGGVSSFAGTKYVITTLSVKDVYIRGDNVYSPSKRTYEYGERCATLVAGEDGVARIPADTLPYGTYEVMETEPATGYLNSYWKQRFEIRENGKLVVFDDEDGALKRNEDPVARGSVTVSKVDSDTKADEPQGDASLAGAEYSIVNLSQNPVVVNGQSYGKDEVCMVITSDESGTARSERQSLPYGSYGIQETKAPEGYENSNWYQSFTVGYNGNDAAFIYAGDKNYEPVERLSKPIQIRKQDAEHMDDAASGAASLAGATFAIRNASAHPVVVNGVLRAVGATVLTLVTDSEGYAQIPSGTIPYGTYEVTEETAPLGYARNSTWVGTITVRQGGTPSVESLSCPDPVIRGDIRFRKVDASTKMGIPNVAFRIKSVTTGEAHIVLTGADGILDTGSAVTSHLTNTNMNDTAVTFNNLENIWRVDSSAISSANGIWFSGRASGTSTPDDEKGALPYDTYEIEELRCDANRDYALIQPFRFTVSGVGYATAVDTVEDPRRTPPDKVGEHGNRVTIYKDSDPAQNTKVEPDGTITYSILARNTGASIQRWTLIRDYIPEGTDYVTGSASDGGVYVPASNGEQGYVEWRVENILPRAEKTITFKVKVTYDAPQYIINTAYVTEMPKEFTPGDPSNPKPSEESNTVTHRTGNVPTPSFVRVTKLASPAPGTQVAWRSEISYTLHVENLGGSAAISTGIYDLIPYGTELVEGSISNDGIVSGSATRQGIGWLIPVLQAGESLDLTFKVKVVDRAAVRSLSVVSNQASWGDLSNLSFPAPPTSDLSNTTNIVEHPLYEAPSETSDTYKTSVPEPETIVNNGGTIRYTLTTTNNLVKTKPYVLVRDYIPEHTTYKDGSASDNGVYVDAGTSANGQAYVEWVLRNVAPRASVSVSYETTVTEDWNSYIRNIAYSQVYEESVTAGDPSNPEPTTRTNELKHRTPTTTEDEDKFPLVKVVKSSNPLPGAKVVPGQDIVYTLDVTNDGKATAYNIRVYDPVPGHTKLTDIASADGKNVTHTLKGHKAGVGWLIRKLEVGESVKVSFTVTTVASDDEDGKQSSSTTVIRNQAHWRYENVSDDADATVPTSTDGMTDQTNVVEHEMAPGVPVQHGSYVTCYKDANPKPNSLVKVGDEIEYVINAINTGKDAQDATLVRDYIPEGMEFVAGSATGQGVFVSEDDSKDGRAYVEWVLGRLAPQEKASVSFRAKVTAEFQALFSNVATFAKCDKNDRAGDPSNPKPGEPTNVVWHTTDKDTPTPGVAQVVKSSDPISGSEINRDSTVHYVLHVTNTGSSVATSYAVYDAIPAGCTLVDGSVSSDFSGVASDDGSFVTWMIPSLDPGASVDLSFDVRLDPETAGDLSSIENQASWGVTDGKTAPTAPMENSSNIVEHVVRHSPTPSVTKRVIGSSYASVGDEVTFQIVVKNTGDAAMEGWTLIDAPPSELSVLQDDALGVMRDDGTVSWRIDLAAGQEKIVHIKMKANAPTSALGAKNRAILLDESGFESGISEADIIVATPAQLIQTGVGTAFGIIGLTSGAACSYEVVRKRRRRA